MRACGALRHGLYRALRVGNMENKLKRYVGKVVHNGAVVGGEYVDWFASDDEAREGYRAIMEGQRYKVKSVTIGNPCIVEIE